MGPGIRSRCLRRKGSRCEFRGGRRSRPERRRRWREDTLFVRRTGWSGRGITASHLKRSTARREGMDVHSAGDGGNEEEKPNFRVGGERVGGGLQRKVWKYAGVVGNRSEW
jgi:hypothetical protein